MYIYDELNVIIKLHTQRSIMQSVIYIELYNIAYAEAIQVFYLMVKCQLKLRLLLLGPQRSTDFFTPELNA